MTEKEIFEETINAPVGSLIVSGDSYLIEREGWYQIVSPSRPEASRNEVIFSCLAPGEVDEKICEVIEFYKKLGTSFKWCTSPLTEPSDFTESLKRHGFRSWFGRKMYCLPEEINIECDAEVSVEKVSEKNLSDYLGLFIEGWEIDPSLRVPLEQDYKWALSQPDQRFQFFLVKSDNDLVGTAGYVDKKKSAYLTGGNILPKFRGRGFYKALVKRRLEIIREAGIPLATTGAREATSAPILEKFGFKTVYKSEIFQYDL